MEDVLVVLNADGVVFASRPSLPTTVSSLAHGSNTLFAFAFIFLFGNGPEGETKGLAVVPNRFSSMVSNSSMDLLVRSGGLIRVFSGRSVFVLVGRVGEVNSSDVPICFVCCFFSGVEIAEGLLILAASLTGWACCRNRRFRIVDFFSLILLSVPLSFTLSDDDDDDDDDEEEEEEEEEEEKNFDDELNEVIFVVVVVVVPSSLRIVGSVENATTAKFVCCHRKDDNEVTDDEDEHVRTTTMATSDSMIADAEYDLDNKITRSLCNVVHHHRLLWRMKWGFYLS